MARPRQEVFRVKLYQTAGNDREAVAVALRTWAIFLADRAQREVIQEMRERGSEEVT